MLQRYGMRTNQTLSDNETMRCVSCGQETDVEDMQGDQCEDCWLDDDERENVPRGERQGVAGY